MNELQHRLNDEPDPKSIVVKASEGYTPKQKAVARLSELKARMAADKEEADEIRDSLVGEFKETGEIVEIDGIRADISKKVKTTWDTDRLAEKLGSRYVDCLESQKPKFSEERLQAMIKLGKISAEEVEDAKSEKDEFALTLRPAPGGKR